MKYTTKSITVRYGETDQMRFVHHSNYFKYFELARLEWLSKMNISYAQMEKEGILMPVVKASVIYKTPLFFGDTFRVTVTLNRVPKATLEFDYQIINQNNKIICTGNTVLAFLSPKKKLPMRCPNFLLEKFN
ncbi:MAG: thioesterase [Flavobacteriaceae bacterium]|nr:thioesterase [Flavobacteriaceae bacterium]|tara:strand:- start:147 stop:542 length:396 start_codon:yes stop_codon:yes gene_type:complete